MGDHDPSERPARDGDEDRRRSRDVIRHVGFITTLAGRWIKAGHFKNCPFDEIKHIAMIEAQRLLRDKYDPEKARVSSFLSSYLFGRVEYHLKTSQGKRKRQGAWLQGTDLDPAARQREPPPHQIPDFEDLLQAVHPDLRDVCRRIGYGESLDEIVDDINSSPLFNTLTDERITMEDLIFMLRRNLRHHL